MANGKNYKKRESMVSLFIGSVLNGAYSEFMVKVALVMLLWLLPILASIVDLITGIKASKATNNKRKLNSRGLRKTVSKDLGYITLLVVFFLMDFATSYLVTLVDVVPLFAIFRVPVFTLGVSISLCAIEIWSVKENIEVIREKDIIPNKTLDKAIDIVKILGEEKIGKVMDLLREQESVEEREGEKYK